jgi:hypothetical protein
MLVKAQLAAKIAKICPTAGAYPNPHRGNPGANSAQGLSHPERTLSRHFGAPFVGVPDPIGPGCPHCDQADAPEPFEWQADAFCSIARKATQRAGAKPVPSRRRAFRRCCRLHVLPLLFQAGHAHLQMAPVVMSKYSKVHETMGVSSTRRTAVGKTLRVKCGPCNVVLRPLECFSRDSPFSRNHAWIQVDRVF